MRTTTNTFKFIATLTVIAVWLVATYYLLDMAGIMGKAIATVVTGG